MTWCRIPGWSLQRIERLRAAYDKAKQDGVGDYDMFKFEGEPMILRYAYYMLHVMEQQS